jgi:arylsulfatase A-like enzyme
VSGFNFVRRSLTYGLAIYSGEVISMKCRLVCCLLVMANLLLVSIRDLAAEAARSKKPNIVLIISDDLSWGDLGCYGQKEILTPNIDRLANEGMRFTNAYAGNSVCAPSRSCLMQGLHPGHARVRGNSYKAYREGLAKDDVTVAEILKDAGYATGLFGKWGLGLMGQPDAIPNRKGFDQFFGYLNQRKAHSYFPPFLWDNTTKVNYPAHAGHEHHAQSKYDADGLVMPHGIAVPKKAKFSYNEIHARSLDFVRDHKDEPFFLYLAHTLPHGPAIAPKLGPYRDKPWAIGHKEWAAMVTRLDEGVGDVLALLTELGIDENTIVLFASDNGHSTHGYDRDRSATPIGKHFNSFGPTRGRKGDSYDGAFRVPAVARWPGRIKPGTVSDHSWAFWDFLPTAAELVGVADEALPKTDGVSILPTLLGNSSEQQPHEFLYWEYNQNQAVRTGDWFAHRKTGGQVEIYDLNSDPQQQLNLAAKHPELVEKIGRWMDDSHSPSDVWPSPGESTKQFQTRLRDAGIRPRQVNIDG